ncbi:MAG: hypothetical protein HPY89_01925 [Pelotomaculum sp.]|nr:hypothetical protein [Pelotomaculum sp.]
MQEGWYLEIIGDCTDLVTIINEIKTNYFQCLKLDEHYFITSSQFDQCKNPEDVLCKGEEIVKLINGIAEINLKLNGKIKILGITKIDETNKNKVINYRDNYLQCSCIVRTELNDETKDENSLNRWIELAQQNENIKKVFKLLNYGLKSYVNMYRIYELIKRDLGNTYCNDLDIDNDQIKRFTATANRPDASGELARHGYMSGKPMKQKPMSLSEANAFIYEMIYKWIHYRLSNQEGAKGTVPVAGDTSDNSQ